MRHVLGNLDWAMLGLCQIIEQLRHYLLTELQAGRLTSQDGTDPTTAIDDAVNALGQGRANVAGAAQAIARAEAAIRSINSRPSPAQIAATSFPAPIDDALQQDPPPAAAGARPAEPARPSTGRRQSTP